MYMGPRCTWYLFFFFCVIDSTKVSPDVVDIRILRYLFVVCIYIIYVRLVMSSYLLLCCIYFDAWCITCYPKREETLEVYKE